MADLSQYIKAGYVPQCGCRQSEVLGWVRQNLGSEMDIRFADDNCTIEGEIAPGLWFPTGYYWEESIVFKKRDMEHVRGEIA